MGKGLIFLLKGKDKNQLWVIWKFAREAEKHPHTKSLDGVL